MEKAIEANETNFDALVADNQMPVLVDFWAEWCGPCRMLGPIIEQVAEEFEGKVKVCKLNVDQSPQVAQRFGVSSIPTVLLFKNGQRVDGFVGAQPKKAVVEWLNSVI